MEFEGHLKDLQDGLGALNDIAVHQQMATRLAGHKRKPAPAFAAGVVSGREQSEIEPLLKGAHAAIRNLAALSLSSTVRKRIDEIIRAEQKLGCAE